MRLAAQYTAEHRDQVATELTAQGIGCGRYFAPIHLQPAYSALQHGAALPVTESVAARTLALPFFNRITEAEIDTVCDALTAVLERLVPPSQ